MYKVNQKLADRMEAIKTVINEHLLHLHGGDKMKHFNGLEFS